VNEEIGKTDNPELREHARRNIRQNEFDEKIKRHNERLRRRGYTPEDIKRFHEKTTKKTIIRAVVLCLGAGYVAGYMAYRVFRWADILRDG
jgi:hypothetical protein